MTDKYLLMFYALKEFFPLYYTPVAGDVESFVIVKLKKEKFMQIDGKKLYK